MSGRIKMPDEALAEVIRDLDVPATDDPVARANHTAHAIIHGMWQAGYRFTTLEPGNALPAGEPEIRCGECGHISSSMAEIAWSRDRRRWECLNGHACRVRADARHAARNGRPS
jgi:hypothetical protein